MPNQAHLKWKKFGVFSCDTNPSGPYLYFQVLWTPVLGALLESKHWLNGSGWEQFLDNAQVGDVFDGKGIIMVVRLREIESDYEPSDWELKQKEES